MFEILSAQRAGPDGQYTEATVRATGGAPVFELANALASASWGEAKKIGVEIAEQAGVAIRDDVLTLNEQVTAAREHRRTLDAEMTRQHERLRSIADALRDHRLYGEEAAREIRLAIDPAARRRADG